MSDDFELNRHFDLAKLASYKRLKQADERNVERLLVENARLREALERIARNPDVLADAHPADIARAALEGRET